MAKLVQKKEALRALEAVKKNLKTLESMKKITDAPKEETAVELSLKCGDKRLYLTLPNRYGKMFFDNMMNIKKLMIKETGEIANKYGIEFTEEEINLM